MTAVALGELIRPAKATRAGSGDYPLLSMTMHGGLVDQAAKFKKRVASEDISAYKVIRRGQLVVGFPIDEGVLDFQLLYDEGIVSPAYGVWDLTDPTRVHALYLKKYLRSADALAYYKGKLRGSTARRRSLPAEVFLDLRVPLPGIEEQRRIAAILDHADALRAKRRQVLAHLDTLTQSIFHEMFGRPGDARWKSAPFGDLVSRVDNGTSPNCESRPASDGEWGVLKLGAVTYGVFQPSENKAYLGDVGSMESNEVQPGDVLMTRKNTRELVGAVALVDDVRPQLLLPDLIFRLHLDLARIDRRYFHALMMNPVKRPAVRDLSSGSAASMPNISKARLATLPVEVPPLELQLAFAHRVQVVNAQSTAVLVAQAADDHLFTSLQSRAFRGDL